VPTADLQSFTAVDASGEAQRLADYLRAVRRLPELAAERSRMLQLVGVRPGMRVLDVGCGLGDDVLALARLVGSEGQAVGLDASSAFLTEALSRSRGAAVAPEFVLGDAHEMPFPDGAFDLVLCERTLQHVADPAAVVAEMARLTASGGSVAASEPDWGTLVIDAGSPEAAEAVAAGVRRQFRHPEVGRSLVRLLAQAGLEHPRVHADSIHFTNAHDAAAVLSLPPDWVAGLRGGPFFAAATGFLVIARRP
jgi:ubiquinone/menaquinone biosynthesis C-methylase UbiE